MPPRLANPPPAAEFQYYELCRRNHDQGRRYRYFPAHRSALAAALTRFRSKLSDLRRRGPPSWLLPAAAAPPLVPLLLHQSRRPRQHCRLREKGCESLRTRAKKGTEGLIGSPLAPLKDIRNETTSDNLDSFAQTSISYFSNTASYVVMPLQSPTNGAYRPISTACHGASSSGKCSLFCSICNCWIAHHTLGITCYTWAAGCADYRLGS